MSPPRIIVSGATTAITRRTTLRKAFLAPWHPMVEQIWLYALADAQRHTGVAVHHGICVVNHHHLSVTPELDNLPEFVRRFHRDISCGINALLTQERYDAPREVLDGRNPHYMRLLDAPAQASHLVYEFNNCVAAGLVGRPEHMPGQRFTFDLWKTGYVRVSRPPVYFGPNRPGVIKLKVTPPPLLYAAFDGDLDRLVYHMNRAADDAGRKLRTARPRPPLGAKRLTHMHPWAEPSSTREPGGTPVPTFRIGARGIVGQEAQREAAIETREFRREYREARLARRGGDMEQTFPFGTYEMRAQHNAPIDPEPIGRLVTRPGPLLSDIQAELDDACQGLHDEAKRLLSEVRSAFADEAEEICAHADLHVDRPQAARPNSAGADACVAQPCPKAPHATDRTADGGGDETAADRVSHETAADRVSHVGQRNSAARSPPGTGKPLRPSNAARTVKDSDGDASSVLVRRRFQKLHNEQATRKRRVVVLRDRRRGRPPGAGGTHGADPPD